MKKTFNLSKKLLTVCLLAVAFVCTFVGFNSALVSANEPSAVTSVEIEVSNYQSKLSGGKFNKTTVAVKTPGVTFSTCETDFAVLPEYSIIESTDLNAEDLKDSSARIGDDKQYYLRVVLDVEAGYIKEYTAENITVTVKNVNNVGDIKCERNQQLIDNLPGNDGNSKMVVIFRLPVFYSTVNSVELGSDKVPVLGEKLFYPEIVSVNGDKMATYYAIFYENNLKWQFVKDGEVHDITDENHVFQEGYNYQLCAEVAENLAVTGQSGLPTYAVVVWNDYSVTRNDIAFTFEIGYLGEKHDITLSQGLVALNAKGEEVNKAYKGEEISLCVEVPENKGLNSLNFAPTQIEYTYSNGLYHFDMPAENVEITANFGNVIKNIELFTQNFEIGKPVEEVGVTLNENANFTAVKLQIINLETNAVIENGELADGVYSVTVALKANEGYGFNLPVYSNALNAIFHSCISLNGFTACSCLPIDSKLAENFGDLNALGGVAVNFILNLSNSTCSLGEELLLTNFAYGKKVSDLVLVGSENGASINLTNATVKVLDRATESAEELGSEHKFVFGGSYVLFITIENGTYGIDSCPANYFALNGANPTSVIYNNNSLSLIFELFVTEDARPTYMIESNSTVIVNGESGVNSARAGDSVTITATEIEGKTFKGWTVSGVELSSSQLTSATVTFTMPDNSVVITAVYENVSTNSSSNSSSIVQPPVDSSNDSISSGLILGIVIACILVLAGGGFAIFWFIIKKGSSAN